MFRCDQCKRVSKPHAPATRVTVLTRAKVYLTKKGEVAGRGREIVREEVLCQACSTKRESRS